MIDDLFKIDIHSKYYLIEVKDKLNVYDLIEFMCYITFIRYGEKRMIGSSRLMKVIYEISCVINGDGYFNVGDKYGLDYIKGLLGIENKTTLRSYLFSLVKYGFLERIRKGLYRVNQKYFMCNCREAYKLSVYFSNVLLNERV